ncbi:hypothetical protein C0992_012534 [Termitomyces sp. T32_za158]|nr:hypothetical protein C0992_012534 [Termitomyces sp. T32_za158]
MQIDPSLSLGLNSHLYDSAFVHVLAPLSHPSIYHPDAYALADYLTYEHCYDTATRYLARAFTPTAESCAQSDSQGLGRDPYQGTRMGAGGASKVQCRRAPSPSSPSLSQSSSSSGTEHQYRKKKKRGKADSLGAPLAGTRRRSRKAYQCPIPGCSKSYLNPNGLKYHQEKGKCKIELPVQGRPAAPAPAADVSATTIKEGGKLKKQEALNFWAGTFGNTTASKPLIAPAPTDPNPSTPDEHGVGHDLDCHHQQHMHIHHPQPRPAVLQLPTVHHLGRV